MLQICLRALPESLSFAFLPKGVRHSFLSALRQVVLLVPKWFELCPDLDQAPRDGLKPNQARQKWRRDLNRVNTYCLSMPRRKFADHRGRSSAMPRIDVRALKRMAAKAERPISELASIWRSVLPIDTPPGRRYDRPPRGQMADQPLSTGTMAPLMLLASSEARNTITAACSSASATRPVLDM